MDYMAQGRKTLSMIWRACNVVGNIGLAVANQLDQQEAASKSPPGIQSTMKPMI